MAERPTPRTDEVDAACFAPHNLGGSYNTMRLHARQLERELAEAREALRMAAAWIEEDEGRTLDEIIKIDDRQLERNGKHAWNHRFAEMCRSVCAILSRDEKGEER